MISGAKTDEAAAGIVVGQRGDPPILFKGAREDGGIAEVVEVGNEEAAVFEEAEHVAVGICRGSDVRTLADNFDILRCGVGERDPLADVFFGIVVRDPAVETGQRDAGIGDSDLADRIDLGIDAGVNGDGGHAFGHAVDHAVHVDERDIGIGALEENGIIGVRLFGKHGPLEGAAAVNDDIEGFGRDYLLNRDGLADVDIIHSEVVALRTVVVILHVGPEKHVGAAFLKDKGEPRPVVVKCAFIEDAPVVYVEVAGVPDNDVALAPGLEIKADDLAGLDFNGGGDNGNCIIDARASGNGVGTVAFLNDGPGVFGVFVLEVDRAAFDVQSSVKIITESAFRRLAAKVIERIEVV